ncbi:VCBS repeat-containing protein [Rasiella sp. SM2506]|uniref:VCBS repeat-containing protein n=1 Tax=Rasiella sp. SM2506 TaxID=3423914 RepID=UPI003D7A1FC8
MKKLVLLFSLGSLFITSCTDSGTEKSRDGKYTDNAEKLFTKVTSDQSNLTFTNTIREDLEFNFLNYPYLYAGAGIAIGDVDKDGLEDVFIVSTFGANKLYKNNGDFVFEDISKAALVEDVSGFTTGASMIDINNDGWLDIYVCKAGSLNDDAARRNKLYVNQQNGTFKEMAKQYGLDDPGYTTQIYQLDYDKDGDLDIYVVNYRYDFKNNSRISSKIQSEIEETTSDQLYRNDGKTFTKVTGEAGVYNKAWGLAGTVGDFNNDGWDDIYISNDFLEPDMLYINQQNGTFKEQLKDYFNHISFNSMGADYADLNNDMYPDLITVDMLAENYARSKENMASMSTENFMNMVKVGYHHAYMANMLHINSGNGRFIETSQMSGVVKTDWSWAPLIADFDNDGLKDIFVSNGVYKDYHNQDFRNQLKAINEKGESMTLEAVVAMMPAEKLDNYIYKNNGDLTFTKKIEEWGLKDPSFSNGAAYADFDNDGDLDLIVNNIKDEIGLYRNNSNQNYIKIQLEGPATNTQGIGAEVFVRTTKDTQYQQLYVARGFESSVAHTLNFGLGDNKSIEEIIVQWRNGTVSTLKNPKANQRITITQANAVASTVDIKNKKGIKKNTDPSAMALNYRHIENYVNDFDTQLLLPQKQSTKGTGIVKADVNGDGLEDMFIGNAAGASAALFLQKADGTFTENNTALWKADASYEDANALFFDADGDGDQDLYVVSAGYNLKENDPLLQDRLYINDGKGNFSKKANALPTLRISGKAIAAADIDGDGDLDVFVGGNVVPGKYPLAPNSYLLQNNNGIFKDITPNNKDLTNPGMISEALFTDYDGDKDVDLLLVGEWMAPTFYKNNKGSFTKTETEAFKNKEGWWFSATQKDMDGDGDMDYFFGNMGMNNKFHPSEKKPLFINAKDFDDNGSFDVAMSKISDGKIVPVRGKECSSQQNPFLLEKIGTYKEFASLEFEEIYGKEKLDDAFKLTVHTFESMYAQNNGDGTFTVTHLPNMAQLGPTLSFLTKDFNNDGNLDLMGVGGIYDAEVETIRYDSNYGYVLLGDGKGGFEYSKKYDPYLTTDVKDITEISIKGNSYYVVVSNNAPLEVFTFQP